MVITDAYFKDGTYYAVVENFNEMPNVTDIYFIDTRHYIKDFPLKVTSVNIDESESLYKIELKLCQSSDGDLPTQIDLKDIIGYCL